MRCRIGNIFHHSPCAESKTGNYVISFPCYACFHSGRAGRDKKFVEAVWEREVGRRILGEETGE
jgi:hypothetical protein